jgi:hypothetical protein
MAIVKRKLFFTLWILAPVAGIALHYGPGQRGVAMDQVVAEIRSAEQLLKSEDYNGAEEAYGRALAAAAQSKPDLRANLQVLKAQARILDGETPEAIGDLQAALVAAGAEGASKEATDQLRAQLSTAHYYAAWLVRLENVSEEEWKVQCDLARQGFRYLSEQASSSETKALAEGYQKNLENSIRLAQLDQNDLKALPLPKQCGR